VSAEALAAPPMSRANAAVTEIVRRLGRFMGPSPWWSWQVLGGYRQYVSNVNDGRPRLNSRQQGEPPTQ
jgi:hypothetical protein